MPSMHSKRNDYIETARIIHMDQIDNKVRSVIEFRNQMRETHPEMDTTDILALWEMFRGVDRREPTHDPYSGKRL